MLYYFIGFFFSILAAVCCYIGCLFLEKELKDEWEKGEKSLEELRGGKEYDQSIFKFKKHLK